MGWLEQKLAHFSRRRGTEGPGAPAAPATEAKVDWRARGNEALRSGDLAQAARCYSQGVEATPDDPLLRLNHGFVLLQQGLMAQATDRLEQALALRRPFDDFTHDAHFLLGRAHAASGRAEQALAQLTAAVRAKPDFVEALAEGVEVLQGMRRYPEAADWAERLVARRPTGPNRLRLAALLARTARVEEASALVTSVCESQPADADESFQRFQLLMELREYKLALFEAERTLQRVGPHAGALGNAAVALTRLGRLDEALARLDEALQVDPTDRGAIVNRVLVLTEQLRLQDAIECARGGLKLFPDDADLHWNMALCHLMRGEYVAGWQEHEWRLRHEVLRQRVSRVDAPLWAGESLAGRTILLHGEQGFGDNIQFVRFVPEIARAAKEVLLHVVPELRPLLKDTLPTNCRLVADGERVDTMDCHAPLMSLPAILGTRVESIPARVPYLRADEAAVEAWRARLGADRLNVGIAWSGNPAHSNDHNRSVPLATFRAISADGCWFFTVQPEMRDADRPAMQEWAQARDLGRELRDFAQTAALVEALDVIVTVDTGVAHLAGALGKPVWILLPYAPDWRWLLDREDSPWYPTARLYRQAADRSWAPVLARVRADLTALAAGRA